MMNEMADKQMMEEALRSFENVSQGNIVKGVIEKVGPEEVFVNIGYKSEGRIPLKEFQLLGMEPKEGNEIQALILRLDDNRGSVRLSYTEALKKKAWEDLLKDHEEEKVAKFKIEKKIKGGYSVKYKNLIDCFMPLSLLGKLDGEAEGKEIDAIIIELNRKNKNIIVSRKEIQNKERDEAFEKVFADKDKGDLVKGKVSNITDFGAFIDFGGIEGLLHITDISWGRVRNIEDKIKLGDEVEVKILSLNKDKKKISLGLKQKTEEPWSVIDNNFKEGQEVEGKVVSMVDYGAFIELTPGLEGLLHISDFSWKKVNRPQDMLKKGETVKVKVLTVDKENKKISLGIKQLTPDPWEKIEEICPLGTIVEGKVSKIINRGIFVALKDDIEGFIHISDLSWKKVSHPSEIVTDGQELKAKVIEIDKEERRIKFGLKQLSADPWTLVDENYSEGQVVKGKVNNITNFGAFIELENGLEGLLHLSDISWGKKVTHASETLKEGQEIEVKILSIDSKEQRLSLGLKQLDKDPWDGLNDKYPENGVFEGEVKNIKPFGAFVELEPGIEGLLHVNDMSWTDRIDNPGDMFKTGEKIKFRVLNIDKEKRQIALGVKQLEENPYEKYREGLVVKGKISDITKFGLFVELEKDINGLVHVSEISEEHIDNVEDVFKKGDEVEARVIENNPADRKIKLSIKQAQYGKVAEEFIITKDNDAGGVSVGEKLKKALNLKN